jgi:hypothetical protein
MGTPASLVYRAALPRSRSARGLDQIIARMPGLEPLTAQALGHCLLTCGEDGGHRGGDGGLSSHLCPATMTASGSWPSASEWAFLMVAVFAAKKAKTFTTLR